MAKWDESKHPRGKTSEASTEGSFRRQLAVRAFNKYQQYMHEDVNVQLRHPNTRKLGSNSKAEAKDLIEALDYAFADSRVSNAMPKDTTLYRGIDSASQFRAFGKMKVGDTFSDKAFLSTSRKERIADKSIGQMEDAGVHLTLSVPKGTRYIGGGRKDESEALLNRGLKWRVTEITKSGRSENYRPTHYVNAKLVATKTVKLKK